MELLRGKGKVEQKTQCGQFSTWLRERTGMHVAVLHDLYPRRRRREESMTRSSTKRLMPLSTTAVARSNALLYGAWPPRSTGMKLLRGQIVVNSTWRRRSRRQGGTGPNNARRKRARWLRARTPALLALHLRPFVPPDNYRIATYLYWRVFGTLNRCTRGLPHRLTR